MDYPKQAAKPEMILLPKAIIAILTLFAPLFTRSLLQIAGGNNVG